MGQSSRNSEKSSHTDSTFTRAEKLREKSDYRQALRLFRKAFSEYEALSDRTGILQCMLSLGDTYRMVGNFDLAEKSYRNALELLRTSPSAAETADAHVGLGLSLRAQGRWKEAIPLIRRAKNIYKRLDDRQGLAFASWAEAGAFRIKGDIPGALRAYREARKLFTSLKDFHGVGYCLCGLGGASRVAGLSRKSLQYYTAANRLFADLRDTFGRAYSFCGIGNAFRMQEDYRSALNNFRKAVRLYRKIGDRVSYAYTVWGLGTARKMTGNYGSARDYFTEAMALFRVTKDPRGIIYCKMGFGEIAFLKGRKAAAKRYISDALEDAHTHGFALEKCHATALLSCITGKIQNACYNQLGLKLRFRDLPMNIP